jgi:hypothetical protein
MRVIYKVTVIKGDNKLMLVKEVFAVDLETIWGLNTTKVIVYQDNFQFTVRPGLSITVSLGSLGSWHIEESDGQLITEKVTGVFTLIDIPQYYLVLSTVAGVVDQLDDKLAWIKENQSVIQFYLAQ